MLLCIVFMFQKSTTKIILGHFSTKKVQKPSFRIIVMKTSSDYIEKFWIKISLIFDFFWTISSMNPCLIFEKN